MFGKRFITILLSCSLIISPVYSASNWVNEWVGSAIVNTPTEFRSDREYGMTFGRFSSRVKTETINPITIYPPQFQIGGACGGIDFFAGGLSFMKPEYLLDKLKGAVAGAPSALFLLALSQFCPSCEKAISTIENIANQINQLQFNECQMRQRIVAVMADKLGLEVQKEERDTKQILKKTREDSDIKAAKREAQENPSNISEECFAYGSIISALKGGSTLLDALKAELLQNIRVELDRSQVSAFEAIDFLTPFISNYRLDDKGIVQPARVKCSADNLLDYVVQGKKVTIQQDKCKLEDTTNGNQTNECRWGTNSNIYNYVYSCMNSIKDKVARGDTNLNNDEKKFLNLVKDYDLVYGAIFSEINKKDYTAISKVSKYLAIQMALSIINDSIGIFGQFLEMSDLVLRGSSQMTTDQCLIEREVLSRLQNTLTQMKQDLLMVFEGVYKQANQSSNTINTYMNLRKTLSDEYVETKFKIYSMFVGKSVIGSSAGGR